MNSARRIRRLPLALGLAAILWAPASAAAHSLRLFAEGDGTVIRGSVYFHGGNPAVDVLVTAFGPEDRKLGEARTDAQGAFTLPVRYRCDYRLLASTADGHGAEYPVAAEGLSASLPPLGAETDSPVGEAASPADEPPPADDDLAAIRSQLSALREQLAAYEHRTRLRDVVGGIGYILGLAGIGFYVAARRAARAGNA